MSKKFKKINILFLEDSRVSYLILNKDDRGLFIDRFETADLEEGVLKGGEILKAGFLQKVLKKIKKQIKADNIHLLLPHDLFGFDHMSFKKAPKKHLEKQIKDFFKKEKEGIKWATTHDFEYDVIQHDDMVNLSIRTLPRTLHKVYSLVFKRAGFTIESIHSEAVAFAGLLPKKGRISDIFLRENETLVLEYRDGVYLSSKSFALSYGTLSANISKVLSLDTAQSLRILKEYGVQKNHRDTKVLSLINRSLGHIFEFIKKRKTKEDLQFFVHFSDFPVRGFRERIQMSVADSVAEFDIHELADTPIHKVLSLEKKNLNKYLPLLARATFLAKQKK